jgi:tyrosinase
MINKITRRTLLGTSAATALVASLPRMAGAATGATHVRKNATDPAAAKDMASYRIAVEKMLSLPPDDAHNWYRIAMIHMSDCPHGNWWFFTWHRPFISYFEQIIRVYSGDPEFALPYWDWSAQPHLPKQFFVTPADPDNPLDPTSGHYYETQQDFMAAFGTLSQQLYDDYSDAQKAQLKKRLIPDAASYVKQVHDNIATNRSLNRWNTAKYKIDYQHPDLVDLPADMVPWGSPIAAATNVKPEKIRTGIKSPDFAMPQKGSVASVYFNSPIADTHHDYAGSAIIEGFPHNTTHNFLGNAMQSLLSPVDPIFFLHHCNVDRIWDVWDQRQTNLGRSTQPLPADQAKYYPEEFLFYVNAQGKTVTDRTTAKDAMSKAYFDYSYTAGTGSELIGSPATELIASNFSNAVEASAVGVGTTSLALVALPGSIAETFKAAPEERDHVATVTFIPPSSPGSLVYELYVAPGGETAEPGVGNTLLAGTFEFFGMQGMRHDAMSKPIHITYDISEAMDELGTRGLLDANQSLSFAVVPHSKLVGDEQVPQIREGQLLGVSVAAI